MEWKGEEKTETIKKTLVQKAKQTERHNLNAIYIGNTCRLNDPL